MIFTISFPDDDSVLLSHRGQPYVSWSLGRVCFKRDISLIALVNAHKPHLPLFLFMLYAISVGRCLKSLQYRRRNRGLAETSAFTLYSKFRGTQIRFSFNESNEVVVSKRFNESLADVKVRNEVSGAARFYQFYNNPIEVTKVSECEVQSNFVKLRRIFLNDQSLTKLVETRPIENTVQAPELLRCSFDFPNSPLNELRVRFELTFAHLQIDVCFQHGDLNPSNVCIDGAQLIFIDFEHYTDEGPVWLDYCRYIYSRLRFYERHTPLKLLNTISPFIEGADRKFAFVYLMFEECARREENGLANEYELTVLQGLSVEDDFVDSLRL